MPTTLEDRARDVFYATIGAGDAFAEWARTLVTEASPDRARERFEQYAARGRELVNRAEAEGARAVRETGRAAGREETRRYEDMTVEELQQVAAERGIEGRSGMKKAELVRALRT